MQSISATSMRWPSPVRARCTSAVWIAEIAENAAEHVGDEDGARRGPIPVPGIAHQRTVEAAFGMNDHGIGGALGGGTGLPVARDRAIDQPRVDGTQRLVAEAETIHHARTKILDHDVGLRDQPVHQLDRVGAFQVEREAALSRR